GFIQLETGTAQAGEVVGVINYATRMLASFGVFSFLIMNISRGRASAKRINDVLDPVADDLVHESNSMGIVKGNVEFNEVSFLYPETNRLVLDQINFHVKAGERIGILGETGSGKTTLLHLIPDLFRPSNGTIYVDDKPLKEWGNEVRHDVTLVPQEGFLFSGTILSNITWGNEHLSLEQAEKVAKEAQLHDFIMTLPHTYETKVGQRG